MNAHETEEKKRLRKEWEDAEMRRSDAVNALASAECTLKRAADEANAASRSLCDYKPGNVWTPCSGTGLGDAALQVWKEQGSPRPLRYSGDMPEAHVGIVWIQRLPPAGSDGYRLVAIGHGDAPFVLGPIEREPT